MTDKRCPTEDELLAFADMDLTPEQLARIEHHLEGCAACARKAGALATLTADLAAPLTGPPLDVAAHVAGVMKRLDAGAPPRLLRFTRQRAVGAGALVVASAAALVLLLPRGPGGTPADQFTARGGKSEAALSRDVGVQVYAREAQLRPLGAGARVGTDVALTAGIRNLGAKRAYLLLFAVDARGAVHWIAPAFTAAGSDPPAFVLEPTARERMLPTAVVFDDLAPGPLRIVALITSTPTHVSAVEALGREALGEVELARRFAGADLRQIAVDVVPHGAP